jgi:hypothetical protein
MWKDDVAVSQEMFVEARDGSVEVPSPGVVDSRMSFMPAPSPGDVSSVKSAQE